MLNLTEIGLRDLHLLLLKKIYKISTCVFPFLPLFFFFFFVYVARFPENTNANQNGGKIGGDKWKSLSKAISI